MTDYERVRPEIMTGDVIATAHPCWFSRLIRWRTGGDVSHVAIVYRTAQCVELLETVQTGRWGGRIGVTRLSSRVMESEREGTRLWWLPLSIRARCLVDAPRLVASMMAQEGKPYDVWQAIASGTIFWAPRSARRLFCSESVAKAFVDGGLLPSSFNYSEATPQDVVGWRLYSRCEQLAGTPLVPEGWNKVSVTNWADARQ